MKYCLRIFSFIFLTCISNYLFAAPCSFDASKDCALQRDILNDIGANGLKYYAPTNYDHRMSGEIEVYKSFLVQPYFDSTNAPGQLALLMNKNSGNYIAGEIMTRANLDLPPFNAPVKSNRWTTQEINHGYVEVIVKMPTCETSTDGKCQIGTAPNDYSHGFWPAIWMMPTMDSNWPQNGEIDISEAYLQGTNYKVSTATLHFNGNSPSCSNNDCVFNGYPLKNSVTATPLWTAFHIWGFEWQPDPQSTTGGKIITGYFDNVKAWGPLRTDTLPADGANALRRGFNDPNGGYYLIINFAVGGGYAGGPNPLTLTSKMYVRSAKAYSVSDIPVLSCLPPANIQSIYSSDKTQVTLAWTQPANSSAISYYQVGDWLHRIIWKGTKPTDRFFQDQTLPGTNGKFTYFLSTVCGNKTSAEVQYDVNITLKK